MYKSKSLFQKPNKNSSHIVLLIKRQRKQLIRTNKTDASTKPIHKRIYKDKRHQTIEKTTTNRNIEMIIRNTK